MIKLINKKQLTIGMYVNDLDKFWANHPFDWQCFAIEDMAKLTLFNNATDFETLEIDTDLGLDLPPPIVLKENTKPVEKLSPKEKFIQAKALYSNANNMMKNIMSDARLGQQVTLGKCDPMIDNILDTMFESPSTLLPLTQIKNKDEYTFQHSVSVSALSVSFGRVLKLSKEDIKELATGGLLHDMGKSLTPDHILNKPGKLDDKEFVVMKDHASGTMDLLKNTKGLSKLAYDAACQHHERFDGTGYPLKLKGDQISLGGQILAIVDVYDALTSIRVYKKGMPTTEALRILFSMGGTHFDPIMVQAFIKGVGIYPAGTLVRLEDQKLAIVREINPDKILQPVVEVIYDLKHKKRVIPYFVDLLKENGKIESHESYEQWNLDQSEWLIMN